MKNLIKFLLLINLSIAAYLFNPENTSMTGSIAYNDIRSLNPATIAYHKGLSIQLLGLSLGFGNNFLSISNYNDINGANFDNPTASKYYPKNDFYKFFNNGIKFNCQTAISLPFSSINYKNFSFSSKAYLMFDSTLPKSLVKLPLYGNQLNENYNLNINNSINIFLEHALGYAVDYYGIAIGTRIKYLQGLSYAELVNLSDNSSYFSTDSLGFLGKAEYLVNQGIGGSGMALDFGLYNKEAIKGWNFGISIINLFGKIKWDSNNITYNYFEDSISKNLSLRRNEKQYFSINLDTLNAFNIANTPADEIYTIDDFSVIEFLSFDDIPSFFEIIYSQEENKPDTLYSEEFGKFKFINTENGTYLLESENISDSLLSTLNIKNFYNETKYPVSFHFGFKKKLDRDIFLSTNLSTGFNNSLKNSKDWKITSAIVFNKFKNIPITLGFGWSKNNVSSGFSVGYKKGPILLNYGLSNRNGIFLQSMKGLDLSFSLVFIKK